MDCGRLGEVTKSKHENQRVKFDITIRKDGRQTKSQSPPSERVGHIRVESITQVVFRSLESWSAIPDTQTLPPPTCARAFQPSHIPPAADRAEIFRREIYAGLRWSAAAYQVRPDPPVQTVPWDDSGRA